MLKTFDSNKAAEELLTSAIEKDKEIKKSAEKISEKMNPSEEKKK